VIRKLSSLACTYTGAYKACFAENYIFSSMIANATVLHLAYPVAMMFEISYALTGYFRSRVDGALSEDLRVHGVRLMRHDSL
jgi:hypothetical protein